MFRTYCCRSIPYITYISQNPISPVFRLPKPTPGHFSDPYKSNTKNSPEIPWSQKPTPLPTPQHPVSSTCGWYRAPSQRCSTPRANFGPSKGVHVIGFSASAMVQMNLSRVRLLHTYTKKNLVNMKWTYFSGKNETKVVYIPANHIGPRALNVVQQKASGFVMVPEKTKRIKTCKNAMPKTMSELKKRTLNW